MTILCSGNCHVWLGSSSLCTCEAHRGPSGPTLAMLFPGYNPYNPTPPQQPAPAPDVPLAQFRAAQAVNATHLSKDGLIAYDQRQYGLWYCKWDAEDRRFGSWYKILDRDLPADAARIE